MLRRFSIRAKKNALDAHPFRQLSKGDVILRTSDGTDFEVDKCILSNASLVFAAMFTLPCSCAVPGVTEEKEVIDVTETADIWSTLLEYCYLISEELFVSLDDLHPLLEAAHKYQMTPVMRWLRRTLVRPEYAGSQALRIFSLACAYHLEDVARVAARSYLGRPLNHGKTQGLELITALQYTHLLDYRRRCTEAAVQAIVARPVPSWIMEHKHLLGRCRACVGTGPDYCSKEGLVELKSKGKAVGHIRSGWFKYFETLAEHLVTTPVSQVAREPLLLGVVVGSVSGCDQCKLYALDQAVEFSNVVVGRIEAALAEVKLEM
ncbi:hypothetical protein C8Q77DRAFT_1072711 [Trametes polyzona]|nr:hypothetical protein C8Q77DRAFT_1072711 [Trametes polyzona]